MGKKQESYPKMSIEHFGDKLLSSQDLDPVYTMLHRTGLPEDHLRRWLLAYAMSYSSGVVSYISEKKGSRFWDTMEIFASNTEPTPLGGRWPRGRERRHFRGVAAEKAVATMRQRYPHPEDAIRYLEAPVSRNRNITCKEVMDRVQEWPLHGPWIGFKMADLLDRVSGVTVEFSGSDVLFFDSPKKAAKQWFQQTRPGVVFEKDSTYVMEAVVHLTKVFGERLAPPAFDRKVALNEIETILCKWGSHMNWHYPVGIDTKELVESLEPWAKWSKTAWTMQHEVQDLITELSPTGNV
jgi:hypothetical protein